jgi:GTP-binding nuclear protein Ran
MSSSSYRFKIVLIGDAEVGKSAFVRRHLTGNFATTYEKTFGVAVVPLVFDTTYGRITFDVWDCGQGHYTSHYTDAQAAVLMFSVQDQKSYDNLGDWLGKIDNPIPLVICGNKVDLKKRVVHPKNIKFHFECGAKYFDTSAKSNYNYEKPFLHLAKVLTGHADLQFVASKL